MLCFSVDILSNSSLIFTFLSFSSFFHIHLFFFFISLSHSSFFLSFSSLFHSHTLFPFQILFHFFIVPLTWTSLMNSPKFQRHLDCIRSKVNLDLTLRARQLGLFGKTRTPRSRDAHFTTSHGSQWGYCPCLVSEVTTVELRYINIVQSERDCVHHTLSTVGLSRRTREACSENPSFGNIAKYSSIFHSKSPQYSQKTSPIRKWIGKCTPHAR